MENQTDQNQNFSSQVIGNIKYMMGKAEYEGTLSAMYVFGKVVLVLNGPNCDNMIVKEYNCKDLNAYVPRKNLYMTLPDNLLDLIKKSE